MTNTFKNTPKNVQDLNLYAWVGEDEHGSGIVGLKQAIVCIPLAAIESHLNRMDNSTLREQLQQQANAYGKTIRLCKFTFVEEVITLLPWSADFLTADGIRAVEGMTIYVPTVFRDNITEHVVKVVHPKRVEYNQTDPEGYTGAKLTACYSTKIAAERFIKDWHEKENTK